MKKTIIIFGIVLLLCINLVNATLPVMNHTNITQTSANISSIIELKANGMDNDSTLVTYEWRLYNNSEVIDNGSDYLLVDDFEDNNTWYDPYNHVFETKSNLTTNESKKYGSYSGLGLVSDDAANYASWCRRDVNASNKLNWSNQSDWVMSIWFKSNDTTNIKRTNLYLTSWPDNGASFYNWSQTSSLSTSINNTWYNYQISNNTPTSVNNGGVNFEQIYAICIQTYNIPTIVDFSVNWDYFILMKNYTSNVSSSIRNLTLSDYNVQKNGNLTLEVRAIDEINFSSWLNSTELMISDAPPTFNQSISDFNVSHGSNFSLTVNCSDLDGDTVIYYDNTSLFDINSSTGVIDDNASQTDVGDYEITINCSDGTTNTSDSFWYNITNANPTQPAVTYPSNNTYIPSLTPNITWGNTSDDDADDDINYTLIVSNTSDFSNESVNITTNDTWFISPINLNESVPYYIRVLANDSLNQSSWSKMINFSIDLLVPKMIYNDTTEWLEVGTNAETFTLSRVIINNGTGNVTNCNFSIVSLGLTSILNAFMTTNITNFNLTNKTNATVNFTIAGPPPGTYTTDYVKTTCIDNNSNTIDTEVSFRTLFSVSTYVPPASPSGGGSLPPASSKVDCNISFSQETLSFTTFTPVIKLDIINHESFSITPVYSIMNTEGITIGGFVNSQLVPEQRTEISLLKGDDFNISNDSYLIIISDDCIDIEVPIKIDNGTSSSFTLWQGTIGKTALYIYDIAKDYFKELFLTKGYLGIYVFAATTMVLGYIFYTTDSIKSRFAQAIFAIILSLIITIIFHTISG